MKKKIKKIIILIQIILMILPISITFANVINIGDTLKIERGDLGFYTIQYWNSEREQWMYITYSRTYYTDNNGEKKIAYCMNPELDGVGWLPGEDETYNTTVQEEYINNKIWKILKSGYPNVTPQELGVETPDDAYLATKQAVYWILRNRKLEDIYSYFRAGETQINGQNLEDIHRRGEKVISAIYKLVNIGYNGTDQQVENVQIVDETDFIQDVDINFFSKTYKIIAQKDNTKVTITGIQGAPQGTYITDDKGNRKSIFENDEYIKIKVPKEKIVDNLQINIECKIESETFPIYYAKSNVEGKQNYIVLTDKIKEEYKNVKLDIDAYISEIHIIKIDSETYEPLEGVKFEINGAIFKDGPKDGIILTTNEKGKAELKGIKPGKIKVKEIEAKEGYILNEDEIEFDIIYAGWGILHMNNTAKKGSLEITKIDKDEKYLFLEGVEFDLINEKGEIVEHLITDENGKAYINSINSGNYTLKEIKANNGYNVCEDIEVKIDWNQKTDITIENEKKKGQIKIIKQDKENSNIKLEGVKFELYNEKNELIETLYTDSKGECIASNLPIGKYKIKETKTLENYLLNEDIVNIEIKENEVKEVTIENRKIKGQIKIIKTSEDENKILNKEKGSSIQGAKFNIYERGGKLIEQVITNQEGIAISSKLDKGIYTVKEVETGKWYILEEKEEKIEIKTNEEIVELNITNKSQDPSLKIEKECKATTKSNEEITYRFEIKNTGNTKLSNFTWYDILPSDYAKITKISTGTYNQDIDYSIYYKTNMKDEYMVIKKELKSKENSYIDLNQIYMQEGEKITELKICFGEVGIGFSNIEKPEIIMKANENLEDNTKIENYTILEGYNEEYKVIDEDKVQSIVYNIKEEKKLPRTGF